MVDDVALASPSASRIGASRAGVFPLESALGGRVSMLPGALAGQRGYRGGEEKREHARGTLSRVYDSAD